MSEEPTYRKILKLLAVCLLCVGVVSFIVLLVQFITQ